jgi:hypothetical protein
MYPLAVFDGIAHPLAQFFAHLLGHFNQIGDLHLLAIADQSRPGLRQYRLHRSGFPRPTEHPLPHHNRCRGLNLKAVSHILEKPKARIAGTHEYP